MSRNDTTAQPLPETHRPAPGYYTQDDSMSGMISHDPGLLQMMCRFGIPLGVGDHTVAEVCEASGVDVSTFLAVANHISGHALPAQAVADISVAALTDYLGRSHDYFLRYRLPSIRRELLEAMDCSPDNQLAPLILRFYDEFMAEVRRHMQLEDRKVFTYVRSLLRGELSAEYTISRFARSHVGMDRKLQELKDIIIRYYPAGGGRTDSLSSVLLDIFNCETDLRQHCEVEDRIFVPAVTRLEEQLRRDPPAAGSDGEAAEAVDPQSAGSSPLSEREREIVACVVRGASNKEIAARLFISVNTVLTHRKNISRKLNIHSVSGLTIYAIVNGWVNLDELKGGLAGETGKDRGK